MNYWHLLIWTLLLFMSGIAGTLAAIWWLRAKVPESWPYEQLMGYGLAGLAVCLLLFMLVLRYGEFRA